MRVFYAFCRIADDLADEPDLSMEHRRQGLRLWRESLQSQTEIYGEPALAKELREVLARYEVPREWAVEIVLGCEMDLAGAQYRTWGDLRQYCYRVASAVGLVSARIFGGVHCEVYAEALGMALQITNILRDMAEDYAVSGRVYLPADELSRFGVREGSWVEAQPEGWAELMEFQVARAREYYAAAVAALPVSERRVMVAAEIMREVYGSLLDLMEHDGFRVWERAYRLSRGKKMWLAASVFARSAVRSARELRRRRRGLSLLGPMLS
jgi:phytoene synthase